MKKNSGENFGVVEVDPITGEYFVKLPEWAMTELSWYEDTEIVIAVEGDEIILSEKTDDD
jgi:hypothetical protein